MKGKFHDSPRMIRTQDGYSLVYGPHGMPVYFRGKDERLGGATVFGEAFSTVQPRTSNRVSARISTPPCCA